MFEARVTHSQLGLRLSGKGWMRAGPCRTSSFTLENSGEVRLSRCFTISVTIMDALKQATKGIEGENPFFCSVSDSLDR